MVIENQIPKTETVYELKEKYEIPSFAEFMETYQPSEESEILAEAEYQDQVLRGSQYGPGKRDFKGLCRRIKSDLTSKFGKITAKISCESDPYKGDGCNYVGAIIYAINGDFSWRNERGEAAGRNGRSFYIIIKCTDGQTSFKPRGSGIVHSGLIKETLGFNLDDNSEARKVCAGGFAWKDRELRFNSFYLNGRDQNNGESDGSSALSAYEEVLVKFFWEKYKEKRPDDVFDIPSYLI